METEHRNLFLDVVSFIKIQHVNFTHLVASIGNALLFLLLNHAPMVYPFPSEGHLGCLQFGATMNKTTINALHMVLAGGFSSKESFCLNQET